MLKFSFKNSKQGYSLMEMAMVLLIISFLITMTTMNLSTVRESSTANSVMSELNTYNNAILQFIDTYGMLPGDANKAFTRLGCLPSDINCFNGNKDNNIPPNGIEKYQVWYHLSKTQLISSSYAGIASNSPNFTQVKINVPKSSVKSTAGYLFYKANWAELSTFTVKYHTLELQNFFTQNSDGIGGPILSSRIMSIIDNKIDDGKPDDGKIIAIDPNSNGKCYSNLSGTKSYTNNKEEKCILSFRIFES
jgi:prepilin-type N-terminal cleavage/methylation domain-containing protein